MPKGFRIYEGFLGFMSWLRVQGLGWGASAIGLWGTMNVVICSLRVPTRDLSGALYRGYYNGLKLRILVFN